MAEGECRSAGFVDQRSEIFDLARDGVRRRVAAVATASTVVGEHREARGQNRSQRRYRSAIAHRPTYDDHGRSVADAFERDRRAVARTHRAHVGSVSPGTDDASIAIHVPSANSTSMNPALQPTQFAP